MRAAVVELLAAAAAGAGCVLCWLWAHSSVTVPPILEGEPSTVQTVYSAPLIGLSLVLATVTGVLAVLGAAALRRRRRRRSGSR